VQLVLASSTASAGYTAYGSLFRGSGSWVVKDSASEVAMSGATWASSGGLSDHLVLSAGETLFIVGGQGAGNPNLNQDTSAPLSAALWQYDTVYEAYTRLASLPFPMTRFGAALVTNASGAATALVVAGGIGGNVGTGTCFDPPANCTASVSNMTTGGDAANANPGRTGRIAFKYTQATNAWTALPALTVPRSDSCAVAIGTKVYVLGGYGEGYNISDAVEVLDTSNAAATAWSQLAPMPSPRGDLNCVSYAGQIFVFGGFYDPDCALPTVGCFNGAQGGSALYNGTSKFSAQTFIYTPGTNSWTQGASMRYRRGDAAVAVLPGGRIVVAGGEHSDRTLDAKVPQHSVEVYYAADDTWAEKSPMPYARFRFALAGVGSGAVYAVGGQQLCFASNNNCSLTASNTVSVFYELDHPDVFVQLRNGAKGNGGGLVTPGATSSEGA
jgi:hypothetical protein